MARISDDMSAGGPAVEAGHKISMPADGGPVTVPSPDFITQADIIRDGQDLILKTADGKEVVIEGYFSADPAPVIQSSSGAALTPELVHSFAHGEGPAQYAGNATANDESAVGIVREVHGHCTIRHKDGTTEDIVVGTAVHQGDIVETDGGEGAVNIMFRDNSTFAVSHNAKLTIDEYVFDPNSDAGASNFSMLRGMFVYTSGQIGHKDPDDVHIHTPAGSIGIRGTVIAGDVDSNTITVTEGAIVLTSNSGEQATLAGQLQTAQFGPDGHITMLDTPTAGQLSSQFSSLSTVDPAFFSSLGGTAPDGGTHDTTPPANDAHPDDHGALAPDAPGGSIGSNDVFSDDGSLFAGGNPVFQPLPPLTGGAADGGAAGGGTIPAAGGTIAAGGAAETGAGTGTGTGGSTVGATFADQLPVAGNDSLGTTDQNTAILVPVNVLLNDSDPDPMDTLSITPFAGLGGSNGGMFTMDGAGNVTFDPTAGTDMAYLALGDSAVTSINYILTDSFGAQTLGTVSVTVTGTNDNPTMAAAAVLNLNEYGTAVGSAAALDPDVGESLIYGLSGTDAGLFSISTAGVITANAGHDFEGGPTIFNFIVTATDPHAAFATQNVTVNLVDVNEAPSISGATLLVAENSIVSTLVGTPVLSSDPDSAGPFNTLTYSITAGNTGNVFAINSGTGQITVNGALNYEGTNSYGLTVRITDGGGLFSTALVTVNVTNVDEAPVITANSLSVIQGKSVVLTTGMLGATDVDTLPAGLTFNLGAPLSHGTLYLNGIAMGTAGSFTLDDVASGRVRYLNNGYVFPGDSLGLTLSDGTNSVPTTLNITITPVAPLNLNGIGAANGYFIRDFSNQKFAGSVTSGDANGDGFDDLIFVKSGDISSSGQYFKLLGGTGTPSNLTVAGNLLAHNDGFSAGSLLNNLTVSYVGKFGPSGAEYIVVGAPQADNASWSSTGNISIIDTATGNSVETITGLTSPFSLGQFGASVAGIGDVNGDGFMDILVGAPAQQPGGFLNAGSAYIMLGGTINASVNIATITNFVNGGGIGERLGTNVAGAGDFNNDGYADFMISEPGTGFVNLYLGMAGVNLGASLSAPIAINVGAGPSSIPVMGLGDVNGDGIGDIAVLNTVLSSGTAGIFFGSNAPGAMTLAGADVKIDLTGSAVISAIGSVGDFNGDGYADFGIVTHDIGNLTADIYVLYGSNTLGGTLTEAELNNVSMAYHMQYTLGGLNPAKISIGDAGDLNGDGFHDVVIGLPALDTNGGTASTDGAAIVVYGKPGGIGEIVTDGSLIDGDPVTHQIQATAANQSLVGSASNDLLSDNGLAAFSMTGGAGNDRLFIGNNGIVHVNGGSGVDQIELSGPAMTMDFSLLGTHALEGIEKISMNLTGQALTLSVGQVFELMQHSDDSGNLKIFEAGNGTSTTSLVINGTGGTFAAAGLIANGTTGPIMENDGFTHTYNIYDHGSNQHLLIDANINSVVAAV